MRRLQVKKPEKKQRSTKTRQISSSFHVNQGDEKQWSTTHQRTENIT
jgi:hypothetical protein